MKENVSGCFFFWTQCSKDGNAQFCLHGLSWLACARFVTIIRA